MVKKSIIVSVLLSAHLEVFLVVRILFLPYKNKWCMRGLVWWCMISMLPGWSYAAKKFPNGSNPDSICCRIYLFWNIHLVGNLIMQRDTALMTTNLGEKYQTPLKGEEICDVNFYVTSVYKDPYLKHQWQTPCIMISQ